MQFEILKESFLKPLQFIVSVVERRQTVPILANVLVRLDENELSLVGTDLEVELIIRIKLEKFYTPSEITVPARKLMDICRSFSDGSVLNFRLEDETQKVLITSGRSRFILATLPAVDFPKTGGELKGLKLKSTAQSLRFLFDQTSFAMAEDDVRHFLNGTLISVNRQILTAVATDGHRLAIATQPLASELLDHVNIIVPRKGVNEIQHLLSDRDEAEITLSFNNQHVRIEAKDFILTSKLVEGRYPDYQKVIPKETNVLLSVDRDILKAALMRVSILSGEKIRGVRFELTRGQMRLLSNNLDQEKAEDEIEVDYQGEPLEVSFNIQYFLEVLNVLEPGYIQIHLTTASGSALISQPQHYPNCSYVVMSMRL